MTGYPNIALAGAAITTVAFVAALIIAHQPKPLIYTKDAEDLIEIPMPRRYR